MEEDLTPKMIGTKEIKLWKEGKIIKLQRKKPKIILELCDTNPCRENELSVVNFSTLSYSPPKGDLLLPMKIKLKIKAFNNTSTGIEKIFFEVLDKNEGKEI